jgi:hypothetical protein
MPRYGQIRFEQLFEPRILLIEFYIGSISSIHQVFIFDIAH